MINYYLITKPGIILGNLFTVAAGFFLASKGKFDLFLFLATVLGLALIIASACIFNNYLDRDVDKKMERTKNRILAQGMMDHKKAVAFGFFLGILGFATLLLFTNILTAVIAFIGFFVYVLLYTLWKGKTVYGTAIGSISGATPPLIGYCAAGNSIDLGALILFALMIFWQMPHFFSIAISHFDDYVSASIPVLPIIKGMQRTKIHMVLYILGFLASLLALFIFRYAGLPYLMTSVVLGFSWLLLCLKGFQKGDDQAWARQMFGCSLLCIGFISLIIIIEKSI